MKCLERLVLRHLLRQCQDHLDQLQFAYKKKRGVEDASTLLIHTITEHLEKPGCFAKVLFIDFSSAFNTMRPSILINKLQIHGVDSNLLLWILDYLRHRPQSVRVNESLSAVRFTNIGAPQGCVLSPVLFTIYTNDHQSADPVTKVIKYADDTALLGLISAPEDMVKFNTSIDLFVTQCNADDLKLNVSKTKELIVDFRKTRDHPPITINAQPVEQVAQYKYLGVTVQNDLKWDLHLSSQAKKASQRLYHLRKMRDFKVSRRIQELFYLATIESILLFASPVWAAGCTQQSMKNLDRVQRRARRIIGCNIKPWKDTAKTRTVALANKMMNDDDHPLTKFFRRLPSGKRLSQLKIRTSRFKRTFVPSSITLLNSEN